MLQNGTLKNKIALVTGASRGIGHGIALALARESATVIGTATTPEGAEHIQHAFQNENVKGHGLVLDVTSQDSVDTLIANIKERFGSINILVNNAAITRDNLFLRMKEDEWMQVINTDLNSIFRLTKACIRDMIKARWGRIINIGSVVGTMGNPARLIIVLQKQV